MPLWSRSDRGDQHSHGIHTHWDTNPTLSVNSGAFLLHEGPSDTAPKACTNGGPISWRPLPAERLVNIRFCQRLSGNVCTPAGALGLTPPDVRTRFGRLPADKEPQRNGAIAHLAQQGLQTLCF